MKIALGKPAYSYILDALYGQRFIVIRDEDNGKVSLPTSMNAVLAEIMVNDTRIDDLANWNVIYYDTNGSWHGYDTKTGDTLWLNKDTHKEAMEHLIELDKIKHVKTCQGGCKVKLNSLTADTYIHDSNFL